MSDPLEINLYESTRKERRRVSIANTWTPEVETELNNIETLEAKGIPISPALRLRAAYADEARTAHNNNGK